MTLLQSLTLLPLLATLGVGAWLARRLGDRRVHVLSWTLGLAVLRHLLDFGNEPDAAAWLPRTPAWVSHAMSAAVGVLALLSLVVLYRIIHAKAEALTDARLRHDQRVKELVDAAQEGLWAVDPEGRTTFANLAMHEVLGLEPGELEGRPMTDYLVPEHREAATRFLAQRQNQGRRVVETALVHRSGRSVRVQLKTSPLLDEHGAFEGSLATVADVTVQRQNERDSRVRQGMIESIAGGAPLGETLDELCRYVEERSPRAVCSIVLHDLERGTIVPGAGPSLPEDYVAAVDGAPAREGVGSCGTAIATGLPVLAEDLSTHPHWADFWKLAEGAGLRACWSTPITASDGTVLGSFGLYWREPSTPNAVERAVVASGTHIAALAIQRERTEGQLQRTMAMLHAALEASPAGIVVVSPTGRVLSRNQAAQRITGQELPVGGLLREMARWTTHHTDGSPMPLAETPIARALERGETITNMEVVLELEDGRRRDLLSNAAPVRRGEGPALAVIAVFLDVSELKAGEREREHLLATVRGHRDELESIFRATSHDLRAPLVNIEGFSRELEYAAHELRTCLGDPALPAELGARLRGILDADVEPSLGFVRRSVEKMGRQLAGLKTLSRTGAPPVEPTDVDMDELLAGLQADLAFQARQAGASIRLSPVPPCRADVDTLVHVFANLLDNALKHRHPERPVRVHVTGARLDDRVEVRVSDNGPGIPSTHRTRVFDAFERPGTGSDVPGEGLGLAIVANALQRVDGRVEIEDAPGGGTTFVVSLPAARRAAPARPAEPGSEAALHETARGSRGVQVEP